MSQTTELKTCGPAAQCAPDSACAPQTATVRPRVDLIETDDGWTLRADMPGVDEQHVDVSLERSVLTISGVAEHSEPEGCARRYGDFGPRRYERAFRLPEEVERGGLEAGIRHGVLTMRIPKAQAAQPTRIAVKAG